MGRKFWLKLDCLVMSYVLKSPTGSGGLQEVPIATNGLLHGRIAEVICGNEKRPIAVRFSVERSCFKALLSALAVCFIQRLFDYRFWIPPFAVVFREQY